ncbi:MAG: cation-translocating P-type ATPase [Myxococcales bacterium]|nr:MAG: cation-translocating P-type ATPase [Myxococcales bacterium]
MVAKVAGIYVVAVLGIASLTLLSWLVLGANVYRALEITTSVLIVSCPCAFGIATPLAYQLVYAGLRRAGIFVRRLDFIERVRAVKHLVFDKTGTLTTGRASLRHPEALGSLDAEATSVLYNLAIAATIQKRWPCWMPSSLSRLLYRSLVFAKYLEKVWKHAITENCTVLVHMHGSKKALKVICTTLFFVLTTYYTFRFKQTKLCGQTRGMN